MKLCKKCNIEKSLDSFHNDAKRKDGKYLHCKECHSTYMVNRYKRPDVKEKRIERYNRIKQNSEYKKSAQQRGEKFYNSVEGRARTLYNNAKKSSKVSGYAFGLTLSKIVTAIETGECCVTGIKFELTNDFRALYNKNPFSPSLDRIDPKKGYVDENTRIVVWWYNMAKGEMNDETMMKLCKKVVQNES